MMFAKFENGVTKSSCKTFCRKNRLNAFYPEYFHVFEQDCLLFASVKIGVTELPKKKPKNEKKLSEIFSKVGAHPFGL